MKTIFISIIASLLTISSFAHAPRDISLRYDRNEQELRIDVNHNVTNIEKHYIKEIFVSINGTPKDTISLRAQSRNHRERVYVSTPKLRNGDIIEVRALCNKAGELSIKEAIKLDPVELFGIKIFEPKEFSELFFRFIFNMFVIIVLVRFLYYSVSRRKDFLFTYILISVIVFLMCYMLGNVKIQLGFALGLFAIFGIIRYRTIQLPIKEMTYLFIVIGVSIVNSLADQKVTYTELLFTNLAVVGFTFFLEKVWLLRHESQKRVRYDNIELIKPERYDELKADLEERTGLIINRIEVENVNFLTDSARLFIYYYEKDNLLPGSIISGSDDND